jgi:hypothetical protein
MPDSTQSASSFREITYACGGSGGRAFHRMRITLRRVRGALLRLVRRRTLSVTIGLALAAPALWVQFSGRLGTWWVEGLSLVSCATGLALVWTGITGSGPDWIDD